jgi:hypothetical protein
MKENKLAITIDKPVAEVFAFGINPINTPAWIDSIVQEEIDGLPIRVGTIYRNKNPEGIWNEYKVSQFEKNTLFELTSLNSSYKVKYTFKAISDTETELEYLEWMEEAELESPFTLESLSKLKEIIELV